MARRLKDLSQEELDEWVNVPKCKHYRVKVLGGDYLDNQFGEKNFNTIQDALEVMIYHDLAFVDCKIERC